ncbi:hypothetical protein AB0G67_34890 [Streptomyces sp. NPDC021056]|uniref:hypothetical protein n=1 Tax=Streptomyces sp. NPDC021056 TaxID=3155012 RepID=UPI0034099FD3
MGPSRRSQNSSTTCTRRHCQDLVLAEAGALTYHRTEVNLRELLETIRRARHAPAEAAGVALEQEAPQPVYVTADPEPAAPAVSLRRPLAGGRGSGPAAGGSGLGLSVARQIVTDHGGGRSMCAARSGRA